MVVAIKDHIKLLKKTTSKLRYGDIDIETIVEFYLLNNTLWP